MGRPARSCRSVLLVLPSYYATELAAENVPKDTSGGARAPILADIPCQPQCPSPPIGRYLRAEARAAARWPSAQRGEASSIARVTVLIIPVPCSIESSLSGEPGWQLPRERASGSRLRPFLKWACMSIAASGSCRRGKSWETRVGAAANPGCPQSRRRALSVRPRGKASRS